MELYRLFAMLLAIGCLLAALLGVGGAFSEPLDGFTHFAPLILLAGAVATLIQASFRTSREPISLACAVLASVVCLGLMTPETLALATRSRVAPRGQTLKIVQHNLWGHNVDPAETARWLADQHADVLVLEEVVDRAAAIPRMLKATYPYQSACEPWLLCTTVILSRMRPTASGAYPAPDARELHGSAWATFGEGAGGFTVVGAHAPWPGPKDHQSIQTALLASHLAAFDRASLIVAGDFNSTPWSFALRRQDAMFKLERRDRSLFTWPVRSYSRYRLWSPVPLLPIDHIYAGSSWKTVSVTTGPRTGSAHLPLIAVLTR